MKWVIMLLIYYLTSDLILRSIHQSRHFCLALLPLTRAPHRHGIRDVYLHSLYNKNTRLHYSTRTGDLARFSENSIPAKVTKAAHSSWAGRIAPFSEYCTHVEVAKADEPTTVAQAIFRSMNTLGSSSLCLSEDRKSYVDLVDGNIDNTMSVNPVLIVDDSHAEENENNDEKAIARQLRDLPPNRPMTPCQLLHLGSVWYLSPDHNKKNQEIQMQSESNCTRNGVDKHRSKTEKQPKQKKSDKIVKPRRLSLLDATMVLNEGAYLRIHHTPRRFSHVYDVDWSFPEKKVQEGEVSTRDDPDDCIKNSDLLPFVVLKQGPGYCIVNKPPNIPVHESIDNAIENVSNQVSLALAQQLQRQQEPNKTSFDADPKYNAWNTTLVYSPKQQQFDERGLPYVKTVQRLDTNTSGLLVLATSREFAAYFSQLLQYKTASIDGDSNATNSTIQKGYKCLVCLQSDENGGESILQAWKRLSSLQQPNSTSTTHSNTNNTRMIRHYLKASDRAPKLFVDRIPEDDDGSDGASKWYECLMEITDVGTPIPIYSTDDKNSLSLVDGLWPKSKVDGSWKNRMPPNVKAVVEVQVSLITGRTHQIRGQLSKLGFPLVGDEQYGGAIPLEGHSESESQQETAGIAADDSYTENPQLLALQCCHVGFRDAEYELVWNKKRKKEVIKGRPSRSGKWVNSTLQNAWWTPILNGHVANVDSQFSDIDIQDAVPNGSEHEPDENIDSGISNVEQDIRSDMLPPPVQLSPGKNKYVVAKIRDPSTQKLRWFVKSAPMAYHAEVAFDLVEWISAVPGYEQTKIEVTGGGRIDYNPSKSTVNVYGFSYRYGKADHARVANLIENSALGGKLDVTYDLSDNMY